jgi:hypothetical protein
MMECRTCLRKLVLHTADKKSWIGITCEKISSNNKPKPPLTPQQLGVSKMQTIKLLPVFKNQWFSYLPFSFNNVSMLLFL